MPEHKIQNSPSGQGRQSPSLATSNTVETRQSNSTKANETPNAKRRDQPPTPSHRKPYTGSHKQHSNVEIFVVLGVVLEALWHRPRRPLYEMLQKPQLPQRDMYQYRVFVNLLWYAKNYLLLMLGWMAFFSLAYPLILLNLAFFIVLRGLNHRLYLFGKKERALQKLEKKKLTRLLEGDKVESPEVTGAEPVSDASPEPSLLDVHLKAHQGYFSRQAEQKVSKVRKSSKGTPGQGTQAGDSMRPPPLDLGEADVPQATSANNQAAAKIRDEAAFTTLISHGVKFLQLICCIAVFRSYGFAVPIIVTVVPVMLIAAHSALTPYGDDSASLFESTMSTTGGSLDAPATPVLSFEPTSFAATRERFEREREGPKDSTPSHEYLRPDAKLVDIASSDGRASPAQAQHQRPGSPSLITLDRAMSTSTTSPLPFSGNGFARNTGGFKYGQQHRRSTMSGLASNPPREMYRGPNRGTSLQNIEELADAMAHMGGARLNNRHQMRSAQATPVQ